MPRASWSVAIWRALRSVPFLFLVLVERVRQERKWGPQQHPSFGKDGPCFEVIVDTAKRQCDRAFQRGDGNWCVIFNEEAFETMGAKSATELLTEQIQTAAVLAAWWECARRPNHAWMRP